MPTPKHDFRVDDARWNTWGEFAAMADTDRAVLIRTGVELLMEHPDALRILRAGAEQRQAEQRAEASASALMRHAARRDAASPDPAGSPTPQTPDQEPPRSPASSVPPAE